jgi:hypothetical protein
MAFWKRRGADEGAEASTNYLIGWGMLIVVPIVITTIAGFTFGSAIMSAIQTALQSVFK